MKVVFESGKIMLPIDENHKLNYEICQQVIEEILLYFGVSNKITISHVMRPDQDSSQHSDGSAIDFKHDELRQIFNRIAQDHDTKNLMRDFKEKFFREDSVLRQIIVEHGYNGFTSDSTIFHVAIISKKFKNRMTSGFFVHSLRWDKNKGKTRAEKRKIAKASIKEIV